VPESVDIAIIDIWVQDESRIGQQGSLCRIWAPTGSRPRKVKQQQFISVYIYGAACSKTGDSFGLILPTTNTVAMQIYIDLLSTHINEDRHIALVIDNAGWHTSKQLEIPENITLIPLPPYSPELNPAEQIWEWMKHNYLSNMCFKNYDNIVDKLSIAWNAFSNDIELVKSICTRGWMNV